MADDDVTGLPPDSAERLLATDLKRVFHGCRQKDGTWQAREGLDADCPRCNPPGAALPDIQPHLNAEGEPCDCGQTPPQPGLVHYRGGGSRVLVDAAERLSAVAEKLDQQLNSRVHERELLRRAAAMIDEDLKPPTYEERLDWLAKYREVTS